MSRSTAQVRVLPGSDAGLPSLLDDWDALHAAHRTSSPFQSAGWVGAYCSSYDSQRLVTVSVRQDEDLRAAAAFHRERRGPVTLLTSAPAHVSDFSDVVLSGRTDPAPRVVEGLLEMPDWDVLDFREVPPSADLWRVLPCWPGRSLRFPASECVVLDGEDLEDYASGLPRLKRKQLGQQQRGIARAGVTLKPVEGDPERAVAALLHFHRTAWAGRGMNPEHATERFQRLLVEAVQRMSPRREAVVVEFHRHGRVRGAALYLAGRQSVGVYLSGHHADLREHVNLHLLDTMAGFDLVADLGLGQLNQLRGAEAYKLRLPARRERNQRVVLVRPGSAVGRGVGLAISGRRRAATLVRGARRAATRRAGRTSS